MYKAKVILTRMIYKHFHTHTIHITIHTLAVLKKMRSSLLYTKHFATLGVCIELLGFACLFVCLYHESTSEQEETLVFVFFTSLANNTACVCILYYRFVCVWLCFKVYQAGRQKKLDMYMHYYIYIYNINNSCIVIKKLFYSTFTFSFFRSLSQSLYHCFVIVLLFYACLLLFVIVIIIIVMLFVVVIVVVVFKYCFKIFFVLFCLFVK